MRSLKILPAALAFGAALLLGVRARATDCTTLQNPVFTAGSTAIKPTIAQIAAYLAAQSQPVTLIYVGSGSCNGVNAVINAVSANPTPLQTPSGQSNYFTYWDTLAHAKTCDIFPPDGGASSTYLNIGLSDVFPTTCPMVTGPIQGVTDYQGPVQAMTFVVPSGSTENAISAEAAYLVFGFGGASGVSPWNQVQYLHQRGAGSGTQAMLAKGIGVPPGSWYGNIEASTGAMVTAVINANMPLMASQTSTIGIMAAEDVDAQRINVLNGAVADAPRELAYKHFGQNCGYLPDSAANTFDKRNVRDGHYAIWGPVHALPVKSVDSNVQANIGAVVGLLTGSAQVPGVDLITFEAQNGIIPQCAMRVQRTQEVGPMTPFTPPNPCGCYYEHIANVPAKGDTSCQTCQNTAGCRAGYSCSVYNGIGYCEPP